MSKTKAVALCACLQLVHVGRQGQQHRRQLQACRAAAAVRCCRPVCHQGLQDAGKVLRLVCSYVRLGQDCTCTAPSQCQPAMHLIQSPFMLI